MKKTTIVLFLIIATVVSLAVPSLALQAASKALADMTRRSWTIASAALNTLVGRASADEAPIERAEKEIDDMQIKIRVYIVGISRGKLTEREAAAIPELLHCVNDAERISDLALKVYRKTSRVQSSRISSEVIAGIGEVSKKVRMLARQTIEILKKTTTDASDIAAFEKEIHDFL